MRKGFFAALICALVMVLLPAAVYAEDGNFGGGDGTSDNPYIIEDAKDLEAFRDIVNGTNGKNQNSSACAELTADIVLNEDVLDKDGNLNEEDKADFTQWKPIGTASNPYNGTFNGNGHTVSGIYINTNEDYQGLFGRIGEGGTVKKLGIEDSWISGGNNVGGISGQNISGMIKNCYNTGSISGGSNVGGIVGASSGSIENCYNEGEVKGNNTVGGIAGYSSGSIEGCYNTGSVSGVYYVGGIAGYSSGRIEDCYNTGNISGGNEVGGIAGYSSGSIEGCYNTGEVSGSDAGGIAGEASINNDNNEVIKNCYNTGKINDGEGQGMVGALYNISGFDLINCYYLEGCGKDNSMGTKKTLEEFASGEVAYLLQSGSDEQVWGQEKDEDFPILTDDEDLRIYKVTFMVNGREYAVAYGNSYGVLVMPDAPLLSGGDFKYWVDEDEEKFTKDSSVKEDMTVTAVVKEKTGSSYELTEGSALRFETNGGTLIKPVYAEKGDVIDLSGYVTERSGYIFDGWYTGNDFEEKADEIEIDGGMTVYAKWIKEESGESGESVTSEQTFTDVSIFDWYCEGVMYVSENGIMNGVGGNKFAPGTELKREMLATILWNMEGKPEPEDVAPFLDVMSGEYYSKAIAWVSENGIISGYGTEYGVGEAVTRQDFAAILYRYAVYKGYDVSVGENTNILSYKDAFDISEYAVSAMQWACGSGVIHGDDAGALMPLREITRAEAATMLMHFCKNIK